MSGTDPDPRPQPNALASPSVNPPTPSGDTTSAINTPTCVAHKAKQPNQVDETGAPDAAAEADEEHDHVCTKVQTLESKVARLERTVSLLTKMIERSRSIRQNLQKQNVQPTKDPNDDHVDPPIPPVLPKAPDANAM